MTLTFKLTVEGSEPIIMENVAPTSMITQTMQLKTMELIRSRVEDRDKTYIVDMGFLDNENLEQFVHVVHWTPRGKKESHSIMIPLDKTYRLEIQTFKEE